MGQIPFTPDGPGYGTWVQVLRKPEYAAELSINGYLRLHRLWRGEQGWYPNVSTSEWHLRSEVQANIRDRAAIQHLALFVRWEDFMPKLDGNPNEVWRELEQGLSERIRFYVKNIQLLTQSAEDARRDAKQWAQHCETNYTSEEGGDHLDQEEEDVAVGDTDLDVPRAARLAAASLTSSLVN